MKIGIIGAGRVGCSIGKYLRTKDIELAGYYDVDSAEEADGHSLHTLSLQPRRYASR